VVIKLLYYVPRFENGYVEVRGLGGVRGVHTNIASSPLYSEY